MRRISAQVLDEESLSELESGHNVILLRSGKPFAEVVPISSEEQTSSQGEAKHVAAVEQLRQFMEKGLDLGGFRISNRDELYDRG